MRFKFLLSASIVFLSGLLIVGCGDKKDDTSGNSEQANKISEIRIGVQKFGSLIHLRETGEFEKSLNERGITVKWIEFPSGPPMLEALNTGNLEFGTTGDSPPIFAQVANAKLVYIAHESPSPKSEAVIVLANSPIQTIAELKGKDIAVTKGSSSNYTLLKTLEKQQLTFNDITPKYLQPADARAAFESGQIDAWSIWEPYLSSALIELNARVISYAGEVKPGIEFYLSERSFAEAHPELIEEFVNAIKVADAEITQNPEQFSQTIAKITGLSPEIALSSVKARNYGASYMSDDIVAAQQQIADTFYAEKLIPKPIKVKQIVWFPPK